MINKYEFYYKETILGTFEVNLQDKTWKYSPITENIIPLKNELVFFKLFQTEVKDWSIMPAFFQTRIENARRFDKNPKEISYHTDHYLFKLIESN